MRIKRAIIKRFGKLSDETIDFSDGLNIVYGANESGKSTLYGFIMNMLFGMNRGKGRASVTDDFTRFEPKEPTGEYAGKIEFEDSGKSYLLSRDFSAGKKHDTLIATDGHEILDNADAKLSKMLSLSRDIYGNTQSVAQDSVTDTKTLYDALTDKYSVLDMQSGQDGLVTKSLAALEKKKSGAESRLRKLQKQRDMDESGLRSNINYVENETTDIKRQIRQAEAAQNIKADDKNNNSDEEKHDNRTCRIASAILFIAAAVFIFMSYLGLPWGIFAAIILAVSGGICTAISFVSQKPQAAATRHEEQTSDNTAAELKYLKEALLKKEADLKKLRDRLNSASDETGELEKLKTQVEGLRLAQETISRIAERSKTKYDKKFKEAAARIFEYLSADEDRFLAFSKDGETYLSGNGIVVPFWQCSMGTKDLIELSLRLAASEFLEPECEMPILLDDALIYCDDDRMKRILMFLKNKKRQIILFTCHKRELKALDELDVQYNKVSWSGSD